MSINRLITCCSMVNDDLVKEISRWYAWITSGDILTNVLTILKIVGYRLAGIGVMVTIVVWPMIIALQLKLGLFIGVLMYGANVCLIIYGITVYFNCKRLPVEPVE